MTIKLDPSIYNDVEFRTDGTVVINPTAGTTEGAREIILRFAFGSEEERAEIRRQGEAAMARQMARQRKRGHRPA